MAKHTQIVYKQLYPDLCLLQVIMFTTPIYLKLIEQITPLSNFSIGAKIYIYSVQCGHCNQKALAFSC